MVGSQFLIQSPVIRTTRRISRSSVHEQLICFIEPPEEHLELVTLRLDPNAGCELLRVNELTLNTVMIQYKSHS